MQGPGEIMYVPDGWWHAVLNLDHTVAVTQNYVSSARFDKVWRVTKRGRPKMSAKWLEKLRLKRPDLAARADAQPWRSKASEDDETSSSSSSSSSTETTTSDDDGGGDETKKNTENNEGGEPALEGEKGEAENGTDAADVKVDDATLMEMAKERNERKEARRQKSPPRSPKSPKSAPKSPKSSKSPKSPKAVPKSPRSPESKKHKSRKRSRDLKDVEMKDVAEGGTEAMGRPPPFLVPPAV